MKLSPPLTAAIRVALFSFIIVGLVSLVYHASKDKIAENEYLALLHSLQAVLSPDSYDNDLVNDVIQLQAHTIYRARKADKPVAAIIKSTIVILEIDLERESMTSVIFLPLANPKV